MGPKVYIFGVPHPHKIDPGYRPKPSKTKGNSSFKDDIKITQNKAKVIPGEPEFVNPNSYATIVKVIQQIGQRAGIDRYGGNARQCLFLECDGLPYKIMRDIMDNVYICHRCNTSFYGADKLNSDEHRCCTLHGKQPLITEFDWLVPVNGITSFGNECCQSFC